MKDGRYSRKKDAKGKFLPKYNWVWSSQGVINMQEPEHWGYVYFSDKEVGETVNFDIPEDEHVKWLLYENYRKLLAASEDVEKTKNGILDTGQCIMGKPVNLKIECDLYGWCIWTLSPFSGNTLLIKEDGKFENYHKQE